MKKTQGTRLKKELDAAPSLDISMPTRTKNLGKKGHVIRSKEEGEGLEEEEDDGAGQLLGCPYPSTSSQQGTRKRSENGGALSRTTKRKRGKNDDEELLKSGRATAKRERNAGRADESTVVQKKRKKEAGHVDGDDNKDDNENGVIVVNRAPVLTLWVAVVAMREGFKFEEGLSFGRAIAGILAQSKGRKLGVYDEASSEEKEERKRKRKMKGNIEKFSVFGMNVSGKVVNSDGQSRLRLALQGGDKPISPCPVDQYLHKSFGPNYERAKVAMEDVANSYSPREIGKVAYSLYEKFRPKVPSGLKGWGAKGVLDIQSMQAHKKQ